LRHSGPHRGCSNYIKQFDRGELSASEKAADGSFLMSWRPTGKLQTVYATCLDDIEREAPQGTERDTWIAQKHAELKEEQRRIAEANPESTQERARIDRLRKVADDASTKERALLWKLVATPPTTFRGTAALLS
jgi:hypothetical protein